MSNRTSAAWGIYCCINASAVEEAVIISATVCITANELSRIVDGICICITEAAAGIDRRNNAIDVEESW